MDSNSWKFLPSSFSSSSRRYQYRSDLYCGRGYEGFYGEDDFKAQYICPFCAEEFDVVGLCCHIDEEHPFQVKNGVCPVCAKRVGSDIIGHITSQHGSFFKMQRKRRLRRGGYNSAYFELRKELRKANLQSVVGGSSYLAPLSVDPDPLLSSFMSSSHATYGQASSLVEKTSVKKSSDKVVLERTATQSPLPGKDQEEQAGKSEFVQGLLLSTILNEDF